MRLDIERTGGDDARRTAAVLLAICASFSLYLVGSQSQYFGQFLTPSDVETRKATPKTGGIATIASMFRSKPTADEKISEFLSSNGTFPGAREWYEYWTHVSRRGKGEIHHTPDHDEFVARAVESSQEATLRYIEDMKERYRSVDALPDFHARGIGWIEDRLGMALTVVIAGNVIDTTSDASNVTLQSGPTSIFIVDVIGKTKCGGGADDWIDKQPPLTMWVRANGPEIFAGTALPHSWKDTRCAWRYDFEPKSAGLYKVHVKVLNFNGFVDMPGEDCKVQIIPSVNEQFDKQKRNASIPGDLEKLEAMNDEVVSQISKNGTYLHHRGLSGFKMYGVVDACCEACTRARNCRMWSTPGAQHFDECELYFDRVEDDVDFLDRESGHYLGRNRSYSYAAQVPSDFPDIRRRKLRIAPNEIGKIWPMNEHPSTGLPRGGYRPHFLGCGWSSLMTYESPCHYPSDDVVFGSGQTFSIEHVAQESTEKVPRSCSLPEDERLDVSNGRWVRYPYPDDSVCLPLEEDPKISAFKDFRPLYRGDRDPKCWHRDDLTRIANGCGEAGCAKVIGHRWVTDLKRETKWYGFWEPYDCVYQEYGDELIQQCVDIKRISSIQLRGLSIKGLVDRYMGQKLRNINMTEAGNGTRSIFFDTLKMPHVVWHSSMDKAREAFENDFPNVTEGIDEYYWIPGFYYTSEREPHVQVDRSLQFSKLAWDLLTAKGYKMINAFDVTAAFGFDTDGQADGLHINGPPIRAIVTKFFHYLCNNVVSTEPTM